MAAWFRRLHLRLVRRSLERVEAVLDQAEVGRWFLGLRRARARRQRFSNGSGVGIFARSARQIL